MQRGHGELLTLPPGPVTVIFAPVSGHSTPDPQTVDVRLSQTEDFSSLFRGFRDALRGNR